MDFVYIDKTNHITDDDIINDLLHIKNEVLKKDSIKMREYLAYGRYGTKAIINHFGSWNNLLVKLGLNINRTVEHLEKEDIFLLIESLWIELNRQPTMREFEEYTKHSKKIIIKTFGKWSSCLKDFVEWEKDRKKIIRNTFGTKIKHNTPREPSSSLRLKVFTRDHYKCVICGRSPANNKNIELHVDHIVPYSLGGETEINNLQTLCSDCNLGKGNSVED